MRYLTTKNPSRSCNAVSPFFGDLTTLHRDIDQTFGQLMQDIFAQPETANAAQMPINSRINVSENAKAYQISAELAGVDEKDIEITMSDNVLTIKGEKHAEQEDKDKNYHIVERSFGKFSRQIALTNDIDEEKISANFKNGVLNITLPKLPEAKDKVRKIAIN